MYIYDLPFWRGQETLLKNLLGGWQISGASFFRTGTPFSVLRTNDIAGVGDGAFGQPYNLVGDPKANTQQRFSNGTDNNFWFNPAAFAAPAAGTFGNAPRNLLYNPGQQQWDIAFFKNFRDGRDAQSCSSARRFSISRTIRILATPRPARSPAAVRGMRIRPTPTSAASRRRPTTGGRFN